MYNTEEENYKKAVVKIITQLKEKDVEKDFKIAGDHHDLHEFVDGYMDVYILAMMLDPKDLEQSICKFMMGLIFLKYKLKKQNKSEKSYFYGHVACISLLEEVINYYDVIIVDKYI